jgi:hypothetical protein
MPEGETFPEFKPSEPLVTRFSTFWYTSDMVKQWQSNAVFHTYYIQLTDTIESFPRMTLNTLHQYRPFVKFRTDRNFNYITTRRDESKEELQSYYKLTKEDMEEITKEWPTEFFVLVKDAVEDAEPSEETAPDSPAEGGGDEVNQEEGEEEGNKQDKGEVTPPKDPLIEVETSKKRKVSLQKPSARKKTRANKPQSQNVLTVDDIQLIITAVEDASEDILQRHEAKQETCMTE